MRIFHIVITDHSSARVFSYATQKEAKIAFTNFVNRQAQETLQVNEAILTGKFYDAQSKTTYFLTDGDIN